MSAVNNERNVRGRKTPKFLEWPSFTYPTDTELWGEVALKAVVPSLLVRQSTVGNEAMVKASKALLQTWQEAAKRFATAGLLDEPYLRAALDCSLLQESEGTISHTRGCCLTSHCPMCWGRFAANVWVDVDERMFPANRTKEVGAGSDLDLVEVCRCFSVPSQVRHGNVDCPAPVAAVFVRQGGFQFPLISFRHRGLELRPIRSVGASRSCPSPTTH